MEASNCRPQGDPGPPHQTHVTPSRQPHTEWAPPKLGPNPVSVCLLAPIINLRADLYLEKQSISRKRLKEDRKDNWWWKWKEETKCWVNVKADKDQSQFQPRFALYSSDRKVPPGFMSTFVWGSQVPSTTHIVLRATRRTLYFCTSIVKSKIQKQSWYMEYTTNNCIREKICKRVQYKNPILCWHQRRLVGWLVGWANCDLWALGAPQSPCTYVQASPLCELSNR